MPGISVQACEGDENSQPGYRQNNADTVGDAVGDFFAKE